MADDSQQEKNKPSLEDLFLAGSTKEDPEFDAELLAMTKERNRGSVLRPILMLLVVLFIGSVISDWSDELTYFFSSSEPLELGDVADFPSLAAEDPDWRPPVQHNRFVRVEGLPTRISRGGEYEFFRLVGGEFYVQRTLTEEERENESRQSSSSSSLPSRQQYMGMTGSDRTRYEGEGRLVAFSEAPERFGGLKRHYHERYGTRFCEDYSERQIEELQRQRAELARHNWAERYRRADSEERERRSLTPEPTDQELVELLERNPVCVHAYLIYDGQRPRDLWWYVLFSAVLAGLMLFNIVKLVFWFRNWLRP